MPRRKKKIQQPHEIIKIEENIAKTPHGLFQIKTLMEKGGQIVATLQPIYLKFDIRDIAQIFIGSIVLASPFLFAQEVWDMGAQLPVPNIIGLIIFNLFALSMLLFYTRYHKITFEGKLVMKQFTRRLVVTYFVSFVTVGLLLSIVDKAPWDVETAVAIKRTALITLPASIGGAAVDLVK